MISIAHLSLTRFQLQAEVELGVQVHFPSNEHWRQEGMLVSIFDKILTLTSHYINIYLPIHLLMNSFVFCSFSLSLCMSPLCLAGMIGQGLNLHLRQRRSVFVCSSPKIWVAHCQRCSAFTSNNESS